MVALHGVLYTIMEGLYHAYPKGAVTLMIMPMHYNRIHTLWIELFEEGGQDTR